MKFHDTSMHGQAKINIFPTNVFKVGGLMKNPYKPGVPFFFDIGKQCRPRSDAADCGSDQGLHCLLTGISIRTRLKMKKYTRHP